MHDRTIRSGTARYVHNRTWAKPLAAAALALCTATAFAQVAQYTLSYNKLLQTSSILQADEDAAFQPITGGTVLADGTQAAVAANATYGVGYSTYTASGPSGFLGNASFVGNTPGNADGSQAEYQLSGTPLLKTGPGYPIGFNFTYNGQSFDRVGISGQGWIGFGNSANGATAVGVYVTPTSNASYLPLSNTNLLANDDRRNRVVAVGVQGGGLSYSGTASYPIVYNPTYPSYPGAELRYETIGTAPNRVFVVQWRNYGFMGNPTIDQQYFRRMDFQIRLYETTNKVEVRFGKCWRSNTASAFQTGIGGKTSTEYKTFGFYDAPNNAWNGWPYAFTAQANHNGYPGSTEFSQRIPWTGVQGYAPYNNYGSGSAQDYYAAIFHEMSPLETSPYNVASQTISGTKANTPDMMSFAWTPATCLVAVSGVTASNVGLSSATLSWTNTGDVDYAVSPGNNPNAATITGTVSGSSVNLINLAPSTTYHTWVRTNCGGGQTSVWVSGPSIGTLPCVPSSISNVFTISLVQFAGINNATANTQYAPSSAWYENFTSMVGNVTAFGSYPITVQGANDGSPFYARAYFDWDQDGVFESSFDLGTSSATPTSNITSSIAIPAGALAGNCTMRVIYQYGSYPSSACTPAANYGQVEDYTIHVTQTTCPPPTAMVVSNVAVHSADFSWTASPVNPTGGYQWEVRSSGSPGDPLPVANGSTMGTTASASGLVANTAYTLYVRSDCGSEQSGWNSANFTTPLGCGSTWVSPGGVNNLSDAQFTETHTVCPDNAGDVVTVDFTAWNGLRWNAPNASRMYIFDGNSTGAPMVPGGNGPAYSGSEWTIPAGGWTSTNTANKPPTYTSTAANGCLTVQVYSAGIWTGGMGWSADFTCAPAPTCFAPTNRTVTGTTVHDASFSWTAGASPNVEYKVVAFGGASGDAAITSGTSATGSATTAATLTANTQYTVYFRGLCDDQGVGDDPSAWSDPGLNFRTKVGCGGPYDLYNSTAYATYTPVPKDSTITICPDNAGDVVTMTISKFSFNGGNSNAVGLFVYNGNSTAAPIFNSGKPAMTSGANTLAAGAFWGTAYNPQSSGGVAPGPFTSTAANGCLTLHFQAFSSYTYDQGMQSMISCNPAPACSTPDNLVLSAIGGSNATISWGNTTSDCIVEFGPVGFTPGTGATAGTNGTIASSTATSPYVLTGLSGVTSYDVYVRQVCSGPSYGANGYRARFTTSMDCSTAQVISCGQYLDDANAPVAYSNGNAAYGDNTYTGAASCLGGNGNANGPERLYRFTASAAGTYGITAGISDLGGTTKVSYVMTPVANGCAASAFTCIGSVPSNTGGLLTFNVPAAGDYYVMSDANYVVHQRPFTLNCPGVPGCVANPTYPANGTTLALNSNAITFSWPAVFGADSYDVYFQGGFVANTPTNSINGGTAYSTANIAALPGVGLGTPVTWRVVPKNSFGTATCPTDWTFSVGGNGAANAITLTDGVAYNGNSYTANGYSSQESSFWGNDAWFKFTASNCGDSAAVSVCLPSTAASDYVALVIRRASDNAVLFPPANDATYYTTVNPGDCFQYSWFNYDPNVWNWVYETPKIQVTPGESYYVIVDGYNSGIDFTAAYNEISNSPDSDGDGILDCADSCPFMAGVEGGPCTPNAGFGAGQIINCECVDGNMAAITITTDANPEQLSWEVTDESGANVLATGSPAAANTTVSETVFLAGSCYGFKLMDSFGDGIANGGWELRTTGGGVLLRDDFSSGSVSPVSPGASAAYGDHHSFCLPAGPAHIAATECGIFNNQQGNKVYCNKVTGATQYQFEFSDPDAGFIRRIVRNTNYVHFWDMVSNPLVPGVHYFARVRTNVAGPVASAHFGTGCDMGLAPTVPCTELISAPNYGHSCNETRAFNSNSSFIYATPVQGASQYQFRIFNTGEGYDQTFTRSTYILQLKWNSTVAPPLVNGSTYDVQVNVKVGTVWSGFCGSTCTITIDNSGNSASFANMEQAGFGEATLWPNPVRDGQVNLNIGDLKDTDQRITVDVQDIYGKQVFAQEFGNSGDRFNTILQLPGDIASGVYMVNITVNGQRTVQRLSIVK